MSAPRGTPRPDQDPWLNAALQLASRLMALLRSGRAYSVDHPGFAQQLESYLRLLESVCGDTVVVRFDAPEGDLCMNGERLPYRPHAQRMLENLVQEFGARALDGVEFAPGLSLGELQSFMRLFLQSERWKGHELAIACREAGILNARPLPLRPAMVRRSPEPTGHPLPASLGSSRDAWSAVCEGARELLSEDALEQGVELRHVKRLMHPLVDAVLGGEPIAAALGWVTPGEPAWAHAAHTALTAVTVGSKLGLARRDLSDIAVAALLHDVGHAPGAPRQGEEAGGAEPFLLHTTEGLRRLAWATTFNRTSLDAMRAALEHHDTQGTRTPKRVAAPALLSQLVSISDAYVTFLSAGRSTEERPSPSEALAHLLGSLRDTWHPGLAGALVRALGLHPPGQVVELDDGSIARTIAPGAHDPERPWIEPIAHPAGGRTHATPGDPVPLPGGRRIARALPRSEWPPEWPEDRPVRVAA